MNFCSVTKSHTEEHKKRISLSFVGRKYPGRDKGRVFSEEHKRKISLSTIDKKRSELSRLRMKKPKSIMARISMSLCRMGKKATLETKKKMSLSQTGRKATLETKLKLKIARTKKIIPFKDTSIEVALQNILKENNICFTTHKAILGQPDIFIEPNICIFVDGDYWHNYPYGRDKDKEVTRELTNQGYIVFRFWERDILDDLKTCFKKIENLFLCN